jgi:RimJ/RimL family protein N-acetyltransferase/uncharacterized damage-inducible protein DinB
MIKLQTDRLILRYFTNDDAEFLIQLLNSEGWIKYIGNRNVHTIAEAEAYMTRFTNHYVQHGFGFYLVELTESRTPIGMCGFCRREGLPDTDIGFAFLPEYMGKGYAYEAASATMLHARNDYNIGTILGITVAYNASSIRLLEKIGLTFDKIIRMEGDDEELMLFEAKASPEASPDPSKGGETTTLTVLSGSTLLAEARPELEEDSGSASAIRAILGEYARAINELKNVIQNIDNETLTKIVDTKTKDPDCRSVQTVLSHVVSSGYNYAILIAKYQGEDLDYTKQKKLKTAAAYMAALDTMMAFNIAVFERYPNIKLEEYDMAKKMITRWGQTYDVDQLMEHAICHILRHRRQVERFKMQFVTIK